MAADQTPAESTGQALGRRKVNAIVVWFLGKRGAAHDTRRLVVCHFNGLATRPCSRNAFHLHVVRRGTEALRMRRCFLLGTVFSDPRLIGCPRILSYRTPKISQFRAIKSI